MVNEIQERDGLMEDEVETDENDASKCEEMVSIMTSNSTWITAWFQATSSDSDVSNQVQMLTVDQDEGENENQNENQNEDQDEDRDEDKNDSDFVEEENDSDQNEVVDYKSWLVDRY